MKSGNPGVKPRARRREFETRHGVTVVFNITVRNVNYIWILIDTREGHVFLQSTEEEK